MHAMFMFIGEDAINDGLDCLEFGQLSVSFSLSMEVSLYDFGSVFACLCMSVSQCLSLSVCLSVCLPVCLFLSVSFCLFLSVSVCLCLSLSVSEYAISYKFEYSPQLNLKAQV